MTRQDAAPRTAPAATPARFIDLSIAGGDLLLSGKFQHWVPMALETGGKQSEAQVVFDVTSSGPANDTGGEVFSFVSNKVRRIDEGTYLARGTLRRGGVSRASQATVQSPATHSPFAVVTFEVDEAAFPELWDELSARVASQEGSNAEVRPQAWLLTPVLAAA